MRAIEWDVPGDTKALDGRVSHDGRRHHTIVRTISDRRGFIVPDHVDHAPGSDLNRDSSDRSTASRFAKITKELAIPEKHGPKDTAGTRPPTRHDSWFSGFREPSKASNLHLSKQLAHT